MNETVTAAPDDFAPGLKIIRRRRWYLWGLIALYLPLMLSLLERDASFNTLATAFILWFGAVFSVALYAAVAHCPRCGNYFHMHGMTLLYLRKCLHCHLHLTADKRRG
ncbi:MAG: hypothetical protein A2091_00580 [Desulfuromonadales bacterium GWD2_61_12]|nr:MAG: hypothetical protein A2091_00580 [Desulfuromonadales bacterium GWD2_61_12]HAD04655.1 hypothetical protein [Desulfuromonas sp.]HBT82366.1 hypothetical protein [Desulfuromonas sp.]